MPTGLPRMGLRPTTTAWLARETRRRTRPAGAMIPPRRAGDESGQAESHRRERVHGDPVDVLVSGRSPRTLARSSMWAPTGCCSKDAVHIPGSFGHQTAHGDGPTRPPGAHRSGQCDMLRAGFRPSRTAPASSGHTWAEAGSSPTSTVARQARRPERRRNSLALQEVTPSNSCATAAPSMSRAAGRLDGT